MADWEQDGFIADAHSEQAALRSPTRKLPIPEISRRKKQRGGDYPLIPNRILRTWFLLLNFTTRRPKGAGSTRWRNMRTPDIRRGSHMGGYQGNQPVGHFPCRQQKRTDIRAANQSAIFNAASRAIG